MKARALIVVFFLLAVAVILYFTLQPQPASRTEQPAAAKVSISMLYSTEKEDWIKEAAESFHAAHPEIGLKLEGMGSLEAAQAILDGTQKPTLFSPADSLVLNMLADDWQTRHHGTLIARGDDAPQPLVITPLVLVIWEDRASALQMAGDGSLGWGSWTTLHQAVTSNQGWPAVGGPPEWGFVKFGHTDPTKSNSGLQTLLLMSLEYFGHGSTVSLKTADILDADYQQWIKEIEGGVARFESSTGTFMTDMIRFGPSKYDIAAVYESLAISQLENAQGRWGALRVVYPELTIWSDHPLALLEGDWVSEEQRAAARTWMAHLHSRDVQQSALQFGFRPGDPSVPVLTADASNPFARLAVHGIRVDIPAAVTPPDGPVIRNLMTMWTRVVGNR
jgi:hypothetical protein